MWALLIRIAEGVVVGGRSKVHYPEGFPMVLRPVIEGCLERDPTQRFPSVAVVIQELRGLLRELPDDAGRAAKRRTAPVAAVERTDTLLSPAGEGDLRREHLVAAPVQRVRRRAAVRRSDRRARSAHRRRARRPRLYGADRPS
jgi:hypothetical protein